MALSGDEPVLPSVFPVTTAAVAAVGATTLAVARLAGERGGCAGAPTVAADGFEATVAFRSERLLRIDGAPPADLWGPLSGDYRTADGWVRLHCNFDHHRRAAQRALGIAGRAGQAGSAGKADRAPDDRAAVAAELAGRAAVDVEEAVMAAGGCAAAMRNARRVAGASAGRRSWPAHRSSRCAGSTPGTRGARPRAARPRRRGPGRSTACGCST